MDFARRASEPELLDQGVPAAEVALSLRDLRFVNRWLGGRRSLLRAVRPLLDGAARPRLLDVGCGSADLPAALVGACPRLFTVGVDLKLAHLQGAPAGVAPVVADVRRLPFAPRSFDVVTASLFLHHFDGNEVADVLRHLYGLARRGLIVSDLHRSRVPYWFGRAVFPWLFASRVSVHDGLLSIRRAFTLHELRDAFRAAGISGVRVRRAFPYRLVAIAAKP